MPAAKNPFYLEALPIDGPFCDREKELDELCRHARSLANVVLFSPRRFGKTSLVKRVQKRLADEGAIPVYVDLFGVSSLADVASRLARGVFRVTQKKESWFDRAVRTIQSFRPVAVFTPDEKRGVTMTVQITQEGRAGEDLLVDVMESLDRFIAETDEWVHIALDEFQEITRLEDAVRTEGILRGHIQHHKASYFFIGSRRRVLLGIFNDRHRPFFGSAINVELPALPRDPFAAFVAGLFEAAGKGCELPVAHALG